MIPSKVYSLTFLFLGFAMLYGAVVLTISTVSENKGEKAGTYFPSVEAKVNFYQDRLWTQLYSASGSTFWSSPEYFNSSFDGVQVIVWNEPTPVPWIIGTTTTRITRNSH